MSDQSLLDQYGGSTQIKAKATGFFRVEKIDGRWWFVTPEGHGFISAGVNHADYKEDYSEEFVRFVTAHLRDWGFNTIGWTQESMKPFVPGKVIHSPGWAPAQYKIAQMPYMHLIRFTDIEWYVEPEYPDVFSDEWIEKCDRLAKEVCPALKDDPMLMGYFYSDAPNFPGWKEHCKDQDFSAILNQYYTTIADAIRRYDTNHLLLGDRYKADYNMTRGGERINGIVDEVFDPMKKTVDVFSTEYYQPGDDFDVNVAQWSQRSGKPVFLADSAFHAPTDVLKVGPQSPAYCADQAARGERYKVFAERAYGNPAVVGWHWCAFGRSNGRKSGLLDGNDQPYTDCVDRMRDFNTNRLYTVAAAAK